MFTLMHRYFWKCHFGVKWCSIHASKQLQAGYTGHVSAAFFSDLSHKHLPEQIYFWSFDQYSRLNQPCKGLRKGSHFTRRAAILVYSIPTCACNYIDLLLCYMGGTVAKHIQCRHWQRDCFSNIAHINKVETISHLSTLVWTWLTLSYHLRRAHVAGILWRGSIQKKQCLGVALWWTMNCKNRLLIITWSCIGGQTQLFFCVDLWHGWRPAPCSRSARKKQWRTGENSWRHV